MDLYVKTRGDLYSPPVKSLTLLIVLDGARYDLFCEFFAAGKLPHLKKEASTAEPLLGITTFPSTTGPAHLPMLTGCFPGRCNVPGIRWFNREVFSRKKVSFVKYRSYVGFGAFLIDVDLARDVPLIYDHFNRPFTVFASVNRGVPVKYRLGYFIRVYLTPYGRLTGEWLKTDERAAAYVVQAIKRGADFVHAVFPAVDELSHHSHPFSDKVKHAYENFDTLFGRILTEARREGYANVKFAVTSDHGLTHTHTHLDLDRLLEKSFEGVFYYPKTFRAWRNPKIINMISGNGMSHIYLRGSNGWNSPPSPTEIKSSGIVELLLEREEVDQVLVRSGRDRLTVFSREGCAEVGIKDGRIIYRRIQGDPFRLGKNVEASPEGILQETAWTEYPDAPFAAVQLLESSRCGDVLVTAKPGYDLRAAEFEIPEHLATHGSLHREHMHVPVVTNLDTGSRRVIRTAEIYNLLTSE